MRRREFIAAVGGATAWPLAARAQQQAMPAVGILQPGSPEVYVHFMDAFRKGLGESGYVDGKNVVIVFRWPRIDSDRLTELATEPASLAAKAATAAIPIVFGTGGVPSSSRPCRMHY
jgi:putative ABC transport system substrate-binding protein